VARSLLRLAGLLLVLTLAASVALVAAGASVEALGLAASREVAGTGPLDRLLARPPADSVIDAADGSRLAVLHGDQDRVVVPLSAIPVRARQAVLAIEDARFYQHGALDLRGITRALLADLRGGRVVEGGSTITQQYVKTVLTGDQVSLHRKVTEALDASQLARHMTKDQILAAYLNEIYFGDGVYGIATAAEHYFSEPVGRLDLAQAAALAGTIASPALYAPATRDRPAAGRAAVRRRDRVLDRMAAVGFATRAQVAAAKREPLRVHLHTDTTRDPYFVDDVTHQLLDSHAFDAALGPAGSAARTRTVMDGGLRVTTTLDPHDQSLAEAAVREQVPSAGPDAALASVDPHDGAVVAMVGGRDYARSKVNLASGQSGSGFPPGSSFKVFYLVAALEQGVPVSTSFDTSQPRTVVAPECPGGYTVRNAETGGLGRIDLARATAESVNTYYAQLMVEVGTPPPSTRPGAWGSRRRCTTTARWCSAPRTSAHWSSPAPMPPWPTAASTASPGRSPGSPDRTEGSCTGARRPAGGWSTPAWRPRPPASCAGWWRRAGPAARRPSAGRSPARPAPPPATRTPGSPASPRSSPPRSGWATPPGRRR
jgi:membrane peptidoglycan carboxypeptidase